MICTWRKRPVSRSHVTRGEATRASRDKIVHIRLSFRNPNYVQNDGVQICTKMTGPPICTKTTGNPTHKLDEVKIQTTTDDGKNPTALEGPTLANEEFMFCTLSICSSTSLVDIRRRKSAAAVK